MADHFSKVRDILDFKNGLCVILNYFNRDKTSSQLVF